MSNSSNYVQILVDFLRNKDFDVKKEKRNWIRFAKSNSLVYVNASKEYPGSPNSNHGWYDFSKRTYDELVSDKNTYDSYCAILLGTPEMVFVLSKDDIKKIFDEQFMNKPDEWMFHVLEENGEFVLKFTKKDTPTHMMGKFLNQWNQITNSKAQSERTRTQDTSARKQETNETDSLCSALWAEIKPTHHLSSLDKTTIERWTKALGPLRAKITSESYEAWKTKLDVETLSEIYEFIVLTEGQLEKITNYQKVPAVHNLNGSSAVIMCGIRQLQHQFSNIANMDAHKYTVLKNQFPNILKDTRDYWIFIVSDEGVFQIRMKDKFWGLNKGTPFRTLLKEGDKVIFCHGAKKFLGVATLASNQFEVKDEEKQYYSHDKDSLEVDFGVKLKDIDVWKEQRLVEQYLESLSFVKRKEQYPVYFQGGIKKIAGNEYADITGIRINDNYPSKPSLLSFADLQKFLLDDIKMQANYQPIMIKMLLLSGGRATKDSIALKLKEINPNKPDEDFRYIRVYDDLEIHRIVKRHGDEYVLNSVDLTNEEREQLVALCNWKIDNMPIQLEELIHAFDKNKTLFGPRRVELEESEKVRSAFVSDFPTEKISFLELDQYVIGKPLPTTGRINKATFCYRLLYELGEVLSRFGIKSPLDFGIYYSRKNEKYVYRNEQKYASPQEAFNQVKSEIYSILQAGRQYSAGA